MKKYKKLFLSIAVGSLGTHVYGQYRLIMPPAPNTASLGKYVENPVGYYTGVPNISIPLYEIKEKNFSLPISLSYHAGGIKVEDVSSNVGLGWVLNAGGVITRVVKDIPDDFKGVDSPCVAYYPGGPPPNCKHGSLHSGKNIEDTDIEYAYAQDLVNNDYSFNNIFKKFFNITYPVQAPGIDGANAYFKDIDSEPDVFYFNFCGYTGQFVIKVVNGTATIKFLSNYDLSVRHYLDSNGELAKFEVKDNMGNVYIFEDVEQQKFFSYGIVNGTPSITMDPGFFLSGLDISATADGYRSGWYLSKVITAAGEQIEFKYNTEFIQSYATVPEQNVWWTPGWTNQYSFYNPNTNGGPVRLSTESFVYQQYKRLYRIQSPTIRINFEADVKRQDVQDTAANSSTNPRAITGLTVYSIQNASMNRIKRFQFDQDYFESSIDQSLYDHRFGGDLLFSTSSIPNTA